jgi:hypothetical protein
MTLATPKAGAKNELLFDKPTLQKKTNKPPLAEIYIGGATQGPLL